jgi:hypothetical protein
MQNGVSNPVLDALNGVARVAREPGPIEVFRGQAELYNQIAGQIFRLDLTALLTPEAKQRFFIGPHDDPGVRASYKASSCLRIRY